MTEQRSLIVGFDLCNDYSQMSCFDKKMHEPESICVTGDQSKYLIRTVLGVKTDVMSWFFDDEAVNLANEKDAILIENIITTIINKGDFKVLGRTLTGVFLLEKFFRKSLSLLKRCYPYESIHKIMITIKELEPNLIKAIYESLEALGLSKDRVSIQSHAQSYLYYAINQKKELWMNDVGLFDFDEKGLGYYQISINKKRYPHVITIGFKDFSETLDYELLSEREQNEHLTYIFENIAKGVLHKNIVSTLYITGKGFEGKWADEVFKNLCSGRRIFKGQNLYTKGACYAAYGLLDVSEFKDYIFISDEMISCTLSIKAYQNAKISEIVLAKAATPWYEAEQKIDVILDEETEIELIVTDVINNETTKQIIVLEDLILRPNKMTRIEIGTHFINCQNCVITIKDKGFGELFPSSNQVWEKNCILKIYKE